MHAGRSGDLLVGGRTSKIGEAGGADEALLEVLDEWNSEESFDAPGEDVPDLLDSLVEDDDATDIFRGGAGHDLFFAGEDEHFQGNQRRYTIL